MSNVIQYLDLPTAILIIVSIALVSKYYKTWLLHTFASLLCVIINYYKDLPALAIAMLVLMFVGLRNYCIGRKGKKMKEQKDKTLSREGVMKLLGAKEYWLSEDEQKVIDEYRKQKSWDKSEVE